MTFNQDLNRLTLIVKGLEADKQYVDYWVMGTFTTPSFLVDKDGLATPMYPADDNESFQVDPVAGTARMQACRASKEAGICNIMATFCLRLPSSA